MQAIIKQTLKRAGFLLASAVLFLQAAMPLTAFATTGGPSGSSVPVSDDGITPVLYSAGDNYPGGNVTCAQLGFEYGSTRNNYNDGFADAWPTGISASVTEGTYVSWTSTFNVGAVIVKGGDNANVYVYNPASLGDSGLASPHNSNSGKPYGLSNLTFCYNVTTTPQTGSITIEKNAINDSSQVFSFTTSGLETDAAGFTLVDDSTPGLPSKVFSGLSAGSYTVAEDLSNVTGWNLESISCSDGANTSKTSNSVTITLAAGQNVTCTFTNREKIDPCSWPSVQQNDCFEADVQTVCSPNGGAILTGSLTGSVSNKPAWHFDVYWSETQPTGNAASWTANRNDFPKNFAEDYNGGEVTIWWWAQGTEDGALAGSGLPTRPANSATSYTGGQPLTIDTNCKDEKLTLKKHVVNDDGGKAKANDWKLKAAHEGQTVIDEKGTLDYWLKTDKATTKTAKVMAGTEYSLSEYGGPSGYKAGNWTCTGGNGNELVGNVVTLEAGEKITCTIINDDIPPKLTVTKEIVDTYWGGTLTPGDFTLQVTPVLNPWGTVNVESGVETDELNAGWHLVTEKQEKGYEQVYIGDDCHYILGAGLIELEIGETYNCTIKNRAIPGSISLYKKVINDNGGKKNPWDFEMYAGFEKISHGHKKLMRTGEYKIWEKQETGYDLKSIKCYVRDSKWADVDKLANGWTSGWSRVDYKQGNWTKVQLDLDEHIVCVITNDDIAPKVTVKKIAWGEPGTDFEFEIDKVFYPDFFDYHFDLSNFETFTTGPQMLATKVSVTEEVPEGWTQTDATCSVKTKWGWDKLKDTTFWAENGKEYFCIFTNDQNGGISGHKFNDLDGDGKWDVGEPGLEDWTIELYGKTWVCEQPEVSYSAGLRVSNERFHQNCEWVVSEDPIATAQTDENGAYSFDDLEYGWYKVCEVQQDGWTQTKPNPDWFDGCYFVEVGRWKWNNHSKNFGNKQHLIEVTMSPVCVAGFPYLDWDVEAINFTPTQFTFDWIPEGSATPASTMVMHVGDAEVTDNGDGTYSGRILWPGTNNNPVTPDWPGWTLVNGTWVEDPSDEGGNLRPNATIKLSVNPVEEVAVSYPASNCDPSNGQVLGTSTLANTGTPGILLSIFAALSLTVIAGGIAVTRKDNA